MNKKVLMRVITVIVITVIGFVVYILFSNNKTNEVYNNSKNVNKESVTISAGKTLVVYYSATGSTKNVAEEISKNLDANLFEIVPEEEYTSDDLDWTDKNSRVSREHDDESLRDVKLKNTKVDNWDSYETILIGYPIWWGVAAWPVDSFVKANNFSGKTVIPFCTSASSELGQSGELLKSEATDGNWLEGHRFSSGTSNSDIKRWTDSLK